MDKEGNIVPVLESCSQRLCTKEQTQPRTYKPYAISFESFWFQDIFALLKIIQYTKELLFMWLYLWIYAISENKTENQKK